MKRGHTMPGYFPVKKLIHPENETTKEGDKNNVGISSTHPAVSQTYSFSAASVVPQRIVHVGALSNIYQSSRSHDSSNYLQSHTSAHLPKTLSDHQPATETCAGGMSSHGVPQAYFSSGNSRSEDGCQIFQTNQPVSDSVSAVHSRPGYVLFQQVPASFISSTPSQQAHQIRASIAQYGSPVSDNRRQAEITGLITQQITSNIPEETKVTSDEPPEIGVEWTDKELPSDISDISKKLLGIECDLCRALRTITFQRPVTHIYNPLDYAWEPHVNYVTKYCHKPVDFLLLGMNPGPFGMVQTGVPFGEKDYVSQWLDVSGHVGTPARVHSKRPITGFGCRRSEVSGKRLWGLIKDTWGTPAGFFSNCFVYNFCPVSFMRDSGKNVTPAQLPARASKRLQDECVKSLVKVVNLLQVKVVICVGRYAESMMKKVEKDFSHQVEVRCILHPSPSNPTANKKPGWAAIVREELADIDGFLPSAKE